MGNKIHTRGRSGGFTLIEPLVVITVIGTLLALLLPAMQAAREAARRLQCVNNFKQVASATSKYEGARGTLPPGAQDAWTQVRTGPDKGLAGIMTSGSIFIALLPDLDNQNLFNSINFDVNIRNSPNFTIHGVALSILHCPSDPGVGRIRTVTDGNRAVSDGGMCDSGDVDMGFVSIVGNSGTSAAMDGVFHSGIVVKMSGITDGTSNTFLFGERAQGLLPSKIASSRQWWASGFAEDTRFTTLYPMNPQKKIRLFDQPNRTSSMPILCSASSFHDAGCNFAFADGSVRFIRDSIDTQPFDQETGEPTEWLTSPPDPDSGRRVGNHGSLKTTTYLLMKEYRKGGLYQSGSTRAGGELPNL